MKIADFLVQNSDVQSNILNRRLPDVTMRLYHDNTHYRELIISVIQLMELALCTKFDDYPNGRGISGANVGVGLNIIGLKIQEEGRLPKYKNALRLNKESGIVFLINPQIAKSSAKREVVTSNCGSLVLSKPIKLKRYVWVDIEFYDLQGKQHSYQFRKPYAFVIQHEIDHNQGILVTNRRIR